MWTIEVGDKKLEVTPILRYIIRNGEKILQQMCLYPAVSGGDRETCWIDVEVEGTEVVIPETELEVDWQLELARRRLGKNLRGVPCRERRRR